MIASLTCEVTSLYYSYARKVSELTNLVKIWNKNDSAEVHQQFSLKGDLSMYKTLGSIPDSELREEYAKRFTKQAGEQLKSARDSAEHIRSFLDNYPQDVEHFLSVFMNSQNQIIRTEVISSGSLATATVFPREIVKRLLSLEAGAIIVAHNHPSGETIPSNSDRALTKKLQRALEAIDVSLLDHVIIGDGFYSFSDQGLL